MKRRIKFSSWVAVNSEGLCWVFYRPGIQGDRNAHGYINVDSDGKYRSYTAKKGVGYAFSSMREAAEHVMQRSICE